MSLTSSASERIENKTTSSRTCLTGVHVGGYVCVCGEGG